MCNIWLDIKSQRTKFYTKDMKSYVGYARKQANRYGIKGSRIAAANEVIKYLSNYDAELREMVRVRDVYDKLPTSEFLIKCSMTDKSQTKELNFYEICGRKFQDTLTLSNLMVRAWDIYNEYGARAQQAKTNEGVDFKAVSHALRASYQMLGILKDGDFDYPLPQTEFLLAVKTGQLNFVNEVQPELENVIQTIEKMAESSSLPQKVDRAYWDKWLLGVYNEYL